jgi:phasin family protein
MEQQSSSLVGELARVIEQVKLPGVNAATLLEARRKDIEALAVANRIALAGVQGLAQKLRDILHKTLSELQSTINDATGLATQTRAQVGDLVRKTLQQALGNMRELADIAVKSQAEAFGVVNQRVRQNIDDLKGSLHPSKS